MTCEDGGLDVGLGELLGDGVVDGLDGLDVGLLDTGGFVADGLLVGLGGAVTGADELGDGLGLTW
jgi:hypothetical protein